MGTVLTVYDQSTNKDLFKKGLRKLFDLSDREHPDDWKTVVKDLKSTDIYERHLRHAGLTLPAQVTEDNPITIQEPVYGGTKEYTQEKFGTGFKVSFELKKFNKWELVSKWTKGLKKVMKYYKNTVIFRLYNNADATTYAAGFDLLALASASHTCLDSDTTTYSNTGSTALSVTGLETAYIYFRKLKNDQNLTIQAKPNVLLVPVELRFTANQLTGADKVPFEMSNTPNEIKKLGLQVKDSTFLTDTNNWFLMDKADEDFGLFCYTSQEADLDTHDSYDDARSTIVTSQMMFKYGFDDPRMVYCGIVS